MRDNITREVCMWRRSRRIYARHCNIINIGRGTTTTARKKDIKAINNLSFVFYMSMQDLAGGSAWFGAVSLSISCKQSSKTLPAHRKMDILDNDKKERQVHVPTLTLFFALVSIHAQSISLDSFSPSFEST